MEVEVSVYSMPCGDRACVTCIRNWFVSLLDENEPLRYWNLSIAEAKSRIDDEFHLIDALLLSAKRTGTLTLSLTKRTLPSSSPRMNTRGTIFIQ